MSSLRYLCEWTYQVIGGMCVYIYNIDLKLIGEVQAEDVKYGCPQLYVYGEEGPGENSETLMFTGREEEEEPEFEGD